MSFSAYPKYRDSGIEWLGTIPEHWVLTRLKRVCEAFPSNVDKKSYEGELSARLCNYTDVYYNDTITHDLPFMAATASKLQAEKFSLQAGDTIITKDSEAADDIAIAAFVPRTLPGVVCGYHLSMVRPKGETCGAYIKRFFDSTYAKSSFAVRANGLTRVGLGQYALENVEIALPPPREQAAIAAFLDRETTKIDELIAEQQRLIELLKEKRQAVISHAVTKGLNPDAPMKPSGIEWLGDVPAHWKITPLKRIATVNTGVAKGKDYGSKMTMTVPYLRVANVQDGYLDLETVSTIELPPEDLPRYRLERGDVLMNEGGDFDKLGRGHVWDGQLEPCITQNHVFAVRPQRVSSEWLNAITGAGYAQIYFITRSKQSTNLASISSTNLMKLPVILPPDQEQSSILAFINTETAKFDQLLAQTEKAVTLLKERRTALISVAVTGQIDVRELTDTEAA